MNILALSPATVRYFTILLVYGLKRQGKSACAGQMSDCVMASIMPILQYKRDKVCQWLRIIHSDHQDPFSGNAHIHHYRREQPTNSVAAPANHHKPSTLGQYTRWQNAHKQAPIERCRVSTLITTRQKHLETSPDGTIEPAQCGSSHAPLRPLLQTLAFGRGQRVLRLCQLLKKILIARLKLSDLFLQILNVPVWICSVGDKGVGRKRKVGK